MIFLAALLGFLLGFVVGRIYYGNGRHPLA